METDKKEIMKLYHGFEKDKYNAIKRYVDKFDTPWPVYGPSDIELINHCVEIGVPIDDLDFNDPILKKYDDPDYIY